MSRGPTAALGAIGAICGAYAGSSYLNDGASCNGAERVVECHLNQVILPFISAIVVGAAVAIAIACLVKRVYDGFNAEPPRPTATRSAVEVDDRFLQLASWGLAPRTEGRPLEAVKLRDDELPSVDSEGVQPPKPARKPASATCRTSLGGRGRPVPTPRRAR